MLWSDGDTGLLVSAVGVSAVLALGALLALRWRHARDDAFATASPHPTTRLEDLPILVVDLETTGLDVRRDRVVSMGAVSGRGADLEKTGSFDLLVHPERPIPPISTAIHGITDDMAAEAQPFIDAFPKLDALLTDRVIVGHNIGFDLAILRSECKRVGLTWSRPIALDLVRLAAALDPRERDLSLEGMAQRSGVTVSGRHTALGDAQMAAEMWVHILPRLAGAGIATLGDAMIFERRARAVIANQKQAGW